MARVIVRFNRSGNRSNDHAERTITFRPGLNRSIAGGEGLSSSLRSRSAGSPNDHKNTRETITYGGSLINRVGNRSGNRSGIFVASRDPHIYWGLIVRSVIVLYRRTINHFWRGWLLQRNGVKWRL